MHCTDCARPMVSASKKITTPPPGHVRHAARGLCTGCYSAVKRTGALGSHANRRPVANRDDRIEDLEWLLRYDRNAESVARRSGFTNAKSAERTLRRWGRPDLANTLRHYATDIDVYEQLHYTAA